MKPLFETNNVTRQIDSRHMGLFALAIFTIKVQRNNTSCANMILLSCGIKCKSTELYRARVMTRATRATQATPRPRARPARATAASPASWAGAGRTAARAPRTPRTPATPAPAPRTPASASGPWRRTRGGRSWTGAEWMPRMSSMSSWRTFR